MEQYTGKSEKKVLPFFPKTFHRDEPFHLNSPRNYRKFQSNGKRPTQVTFDLRPPRSLWGGEFIRKVKDLGNEYLPMKRMVATLLFLQQKEIIIRTQGTLIALRDTFHYQREVIFSNWIYHNYDDWVIYILINYNSNHSRVRVHII